MGNYKNFKISITSDSLSKSESAGLLRQLLFLGFEVKPISVVNNENGVVSREYYVNLPEKMEFPVGSWIKYTGSKEYLIEWNNRLRFVYSSHYFRYFLEKSEDCTIFQVLGYKNYYERESGGKEYKFIEGLYCGKSSDNRLVGLLPMDSVVLCPTTDIQNLNIWIPSVGDRVILKESTIFYHRDAPGARGDILEVDYNTYEALVRWWHQRRYVYRPDNSDGTVKLNFIHLKQG